MRIARVLPAALCLIVFVAKMAHAAPAANTAPAAAPTPPAPMGGADIYKKDLPSIVYIEVQAKDGKGYQGSGFMAIKDGMAVTCWHVVHNAKSATVRFSDGETYDVVGLIDHDAVNDVALVKVKVSGRPLLTLQKDAPDIGSKAFVIGAPLGLDFTISDGIISQIRHDPNVYQFTCPATHGNSGGPLIDANGQVLGIVAAGVDQSSGNVAFAVPIKYALNLDETQPVTEWKDVKDDTPGDEDTSSASDDDLDKSLAMTYRDSTDTGSLMVFLISSLTDKNFQGVPADVYALQERLKTDLTGLSGGSSDDPEREHLRKTLMDQAGHCEDMFGYYVEMVQTALNGGPGAATQVSDLFNRMTAAAANIPKLSDDDKKALFASQAVQNAIPDVMAWRQDKNPFQLGDDSTFLDPLFVCSVQPSSIADKLGLKKGDYIMSVDGQKPTDMMNVRDLVQKDAGKKVVITVGRGKKTVDLKGDVPASAAAPAAPATPNPQGH